MARENKRGIRQRKGTCATKAHADGIPEATDARAKRATITETTELSIVCTLVGVLSF